MYWSSTRQSFVLHCKLTNQRRVCLYITFTFCHFAIYIIFNRQVWSVPIFALMSAASTGFGGVLSSAVERFPTTSYSSNSTSAVQSLKKRKQRKPKQKKVAAKRSRKTGPKKTIRKKRSKATRKNKKVKRRLFVKAKSARKSQPKLFL